jgi:hypothetical protein
MRVTNPRFDARQHMYAHLHTRSYTCSNTTISSARHSDFNCFDRIPNSQGHSRNPKEIHERVGTLIIAIIMRDSVALLAVVR